jgi:hypothetical protein
MTQYVIEGKNHKQLPLIYVRSWDAGRCFPEWNQYGTKTANKIIATNIYAVAIIIYSFEIIIGSNTDLK